MDQKSKPGPKGAKPPALTAEELTAIGESIWGENWKQPMAKALGDDTSSRVLAWLNGKRRVTEKMAARLRDIQLERAETIMRDAIVDVAPHISLKTSYRIAKRISTDLAGSGFRVVYLAGFKVINDQPADPEPPAPAPQTARKRKKT